MVIDFEATCWDQKPGPPSEIIEFPAVILDASSRYYSGHYKTLKIDLNCWIFQILFDIKVQLNNFQKNDSCTKKHHY